MRLLVWSFSSRWVSALNTMKVGNVTIRFGMWWWLEGRSVLNVMRRYVI